MASISTASFTIDVMKMLFLSFTLKVQSGALKIRSWISNFNVLSDQNYLICVPIDINYGNFSVDLGNICVAFFNLFKFN